MSPRLNFSSFFFSWFRFFSSFSKRERSRQQFEDTLWKCIEIFFHDLTYRLNDKTRSLSDGGAMTFPLLGAFRFPKRCLVYSWIFSRTRVLSSVLDVR